MNELHYTILSDRGVLKISGDDALSFMQGLLTNDIYKIGDSNGIYACMLSPQGKYLYDMFITRQDKALFLECAESRRAELVRKLTMYKLRSKVIIEDVSNAYGVCALNENFPNAYDDPRLAAMGKRIVARKTSLLAALQEAGFREDPNFYEQQRLALGIAEGEKDLMQDKAFPLEYGLDRLNAIDYRKGCYVGQEVTARTTYRGVVRKKIYKVESETPLPAYDTEISAGGSKIGAMRSSNGTIGLALIREEDYQQALADGHHATIEGQAVTLTLPEWNKAT
jgi:folate-binding protein YgfZ